LTKLIILVSVLVVLAISGTAVMAHGGYGAFSFERMLPTMQEHHPGWSEEELRTMYEYCHGER